MHNSLANLVAQFQGESPVRRASGSLYGFFLSLTLVTSLAFAAPFTHCSSIDVPAFSRGKTNHIPERVKHVGNETSA